MQLDLATVLVQVATGGLLFCWVTTRRREVGIGYGWLLRITFGSLAILGLIAGFGDTGAGAQVRNVGAAVMVVAAAIALWSSYVRRAAGVSGQVERRRAKAARVAAMVGTARDGRRRRRGRRGAEGIRSPARPRRPDRGSDRAWPAPPRSPVATTRSAWCASRSARFFLGAVTDAMLLGHWYLVQPGLGRDPIKELVKIVAVLWPLELIVWLIPTGMVSVLNGSIDDGYDGLIGWMWIVASLTTIGLVIATWFALKERQYSAVMAATGLLYLAILTGFGMDLLPRALLS